MQRYEIYFVCANYSYDLSVFSRFWHIKSPKIINPIPTHLSAGRCSPKKRNIQIAVNTGRMLLKAFAFVTPICRKA